MQYTAHAPFVAAARERPALWRLGVGLVAVVVVYAACIAIIYAILVALSGFEGANAWMGRMANADTPTATLLVLSTFIGMGLGPMVAARLLHGRSILSLLGPRRRVIRDFMIAAGLCGGIYALSSLIPSEMRPTPNLDPLLWLSFLPIAIVGVLVQTGAEEILFRGYIQQQLAARFASPLAWMVLPSAIFALLHYQPSIMGENTWIVVGAVFLFALLAADLTARTGSVGAAWGFHFANNAVAILFLALDGPLSGLALYTVPMGAMTAAELRPMLLLDMLVTLAIWAAIRFAVTRP